MEDRNSGNKLKDSTMSPSCFKTIGITIVVMLLISIPVVLWLTKIVMKTPSLHDLEKCMRNALEINAALERYNVKHSAYPEKLDDLREGFLQDTAVLHCPADERPTKEISYEYNRPDADTPDNAVILTCRKHNILPGKPPILVAVRKDGTLVKP